MNHSSRVRIAAGVLAVLAIIAVGRSADDATFTPVLINGHPAHPTRLLAKVKPVAAASAHATTLAAQGLRASRGFDLVPGLVVLDTDDQSQAMAAASAGTSQGGAQAAQLELRIEALRLSGLFEYVEPDYLYFADATPNDSAFAEGTLWGLHNTGQNGGVAGVDVDAGRAWDVTTGSATVIVGVVDSGIRYTHLDLAANMWRNPSETAGNGIDDDRNGYIDDVHGINAITNSGNPMDDGDHGTHVAGTIGAAANNGQPHVGVAWNVRLMALKFLAADGGGATSDAIECIQYAVAKGAKILNNSWGGGAGGESLRLAIAAAAAQGVLFVAAAGNDGTDNDSFPHYPSSFDFDNIVAVAAIDRAGNRAGFSNYGRRSVHLGAPGVSIYSTVSATDSSYDVFSGTSMAAPHVSGVAALIRAQFPGITLSDLRDRLLQTTIATPSLQGSTTSGGRVNAYQALTATGDGQLEVSVAPATGATLIHGRTTAVVVRVTDLVGVKGATVIGNTAGGGAITFRDDGGGPDVAANDSRYTANVTAPASGAQLVLSINASAPGKTAAQAEVTYTLTAPAPNDRFANRIPLAFSDGSTNGSNLGGTREPGEPTLAGQPGGASVWWTWTAPGNATVTVTTIGSNFDTLLGVFTGTSVNALTAIATNDDISGPNQPSSVTFSALAGTPYHLVVDGWDGATGIIQLNIATAIRPPNDNFASRIELIGPTVAVSGSTINATRELNEPFPGGSQSNESVWWTWTAPFSGTATVSVVDSTNRMMGFVGAFTGANLATLIPVPGSGDDLQGVSIPRTTFGALEGTTYQIAVASVVQADFSLSLNLAPGPVNDFFVSRTVIAGADVTVMGSNGNATREVGEPEPLPGAQSRASVWWTWTAPANGTAIIEVTTDNFVPLMAAYTGQSVSALTEVAHRSSNTFNGFTGEARFTAVAGTVYQVMVASAETRVGNITLHVALVNPPTNDNFADRNAITGSTISVVGTHRGATREPGDVNLGSGATVWWTWTAPADGTATVSSPANGVQLGVYTGSSLATLRPVQSAVMAYPVVPLVIFHAVAGQSYAIVAAGDGGAFTLDLSLVDGPANDLFANRTTLAGPSASVTLSAAGATFEEGEPPHEFDFAVIGLANLWYSWTAPADGTVYLNATEGNGWLPLAVYTGSTLPSLSRVADTNGQTNNRGNFRFSARTGTTYQIAVFFEGHAQGSVPFTLRLIGNPTNDNFADRTVITGSAVTTPGSNAGATREGGEPVHSSYGGGATIWWTWTAPASGTVTVTSAGSEIGCALAVYSGSTLSSLTAIGADDYAPEGYVRVTFSATAGASYQIALEGIYLAVGNVMLNLTRLDVPPNDLFASRETISGNDVTVTGTNAGATWEPDEPSHIGDRASVWWTWTAPATGAAVLTTGGSAGRTTLSVYKGASIAALQMVASDWGDNSERAQLALRVEGGTTYQIAVDSRFLETGEIVLNLKFYPPPPNDAFANRAPIVGTVVTVDATNYGATAEPGEPRSGMGFSANSTVWWTWTAPRSGTATISIPVLILDVYTGDSLATLAPVYDNAGGALNRTVFRADAGVTYQISVDAYGAIGGVFSLVLTLADGPPNDQFADRTALSGANVAVSGTFANGTLEMGEPPPARTSTSWWKWTAPVSGRTYIQSNGGVHSLTVYTGGTLASLVWIGSAVRFPNHDAVVSFDAVAGTEYQIMLGDASDFNYGLDPSGAVTLRITIADRPVNDAFANAAALTGSSASTSGSILGATAEAGEPLMQNQILASSIWWTWTAPRDGRVLLSTEGSNFLPTLGVFTGASLNALVAVPVRAGTKTPFLTFDAVAGMTYRIVLGGINGAVGNFAFALSYVEPPANDNFADRQVLLGTINTVLTTNVGAGAESGEPGWFNTIAKTSLWWTWTVPLSGKVRIIATGDGFRPIASAYTGSAMNTLTPADSTVDVGENTWALSFHADAGTVLQLAVDGITEGMGELTLKAGIHPPPPNDMFADRIMVTGATFTATGNNLGATRDPGAWYAGYNDGSASVWWTWTAPTSGPFALSTAGSDFDTTLGVHTGTDVSLLTTVAYGGDVSQDDHTSSVIFQAVAGTTYQIAVDGAAFAAGNIFLQLRSALVDGVWVELNSTSVLADSPVILTAHANGTGPFSYQWTLDGVEIPDAYEAAIQLASAQSFYSGAYTVRVSNGYASATSVPTVLAIAEPPTSNARLTNLSTRALALTGDNVLIPGFVVAGSGNKQLLIRAVGPTLQTFGVSGVLPNPRLTLKRWNGSAYVDVATNDDWGNNSNAAAIVAKSAELYAFPLAEGSADAALLVDLAPGQYSAVAGGAGTQTGIAIVELYDADSNGGAARLINISNRGHVGAGDSIMIPGFVVSSEGPKTLLIRAVGPTLATFGVPSVLADPTLSIYRRNQNTNTDELILTNDDWSTGPGAQRTRDVAAQVQAFALPDGSKDAAFVVTLNPGIYTVHARGANDSTGVALVEVYAVP